MISETCKNHEKEYIKCKTEGKTWHMQQCCIDFQKYDLRSLGKMKVEFEGQAQVSLTSKSYFCVGSTCKQVSKGVSIKQNPLNFDRYVQVLQTNTPLEITNRGFRATNHSVFTYAQRKKGLNSFYAKRVVLNDTVHTVPLSI